MPPFLAIGGYYSSPTKDMGEKGRFASIIDAISKFITTNWIFFLILLLIILMVSYYLYRRLKRKKEEFSSNPANSITDTS